MKKVLSLIIVLLLSMALTGCNMQSLLGGLMGSKEKTSSKSSQQEEKKIIAVALNQEDPNKDMFLLGIQELAEKEELEVKVLTSKEQGDANALKDAKVLIVQAGEQSFLKEAEKGDIPILALNGLPPGVKAKGVILPDPDQTGRLMAQQIQGKVTEGQVVYLQGEAEDAVAQMNMAAFKQELGKNPKITVHSITNPPESETIAMQSLMEHLQKNPGQVKAICAKNEKLLALAYELLRSMQLTDKVQLMGGQANSKSLQRIASGSQIADIDTSPYVQGVNAFQWAQKLMDKQSVDITQSITGDQGEVAAKIIPVKTVTTENLALIQKSYAKAAEAQKELERKKSESQTKGSESQGKQKSTEKSSNEDSGKEQSGEGKDAESKEQGQEGSSSAQGQSGGQGVMPEGVSKVTEKVHTEILREYLDEKGNVLGTEKNANDQVRTIPPEMLLKEQQQQQQQQQQQGEQGQQGDRQDKQGGNSSEQAKQGE
ncbi:ABC-type sugar transport system periplasmic component-like protein [Desulfitobacterium hafniense DCB-2]|uniref:ABC-type sugar transport system periplasmic component-like protein n=1 Tax=Desulfitobacterium hafniense (strain DSM 10664 / DCB-2) TaxID=272564 RepID=B8FYX9_DESHD|nr:substrate-binding domain-containing protein [Desulfitobacterium hafniense]ACL22731.1 ABC-type sugar transport system periplasmic component-like protein [Desulfitobacterium hafniense DCB-2]